jgi:hypothetical protein
MVRMWSNFPGWSKMLTILEFEFIKNFEIDI